MFEHEARIFAFQKGYLHALTAEMVDSQLDLVPAAGIKPPRWILGHINLGNDYILNQLGLGTTSPEAWYRAFGPGSDAFASPEVTPSKQELLDAFNASAALVLEAVSKANHELMSTRHELPMPLLRRGLPTRGDLVAHLLTSHLALHLGQLSTWRRALGLPQSSECDTISIQHTQTRLATDRTSHRPCTSCLQPPRSSRNRVPSAAPRSSRNPTCPTDRSMT